MTIKIKGNLILKGNTEYSESIDVEGHIICESERFSLKVAGNINAWDITAWNITARDIIAWNINAGNITAGNINAGNIIYYAVCFAYQNIKCKSIKGRKKKHKHFCLDGKITQSCQKQEKK